MDTLSRKVKKILKQAFPQPDKIYLRPESDGIIGIVASKRFTGMKMKRRAGIVDGVLDNKLSSEEKRRITLIVPMTPEEADAHPELTLVGENSR